MCHANCSKVKGALTPAESDVLDSKVLAVVVVSEFSCFISFSTVLVHVTVRSLPFVMQQFLAFIAGLYSPGPVDFGSVVHSGSETSTLCHSAYVSHAE